MVVSINHHLNSFIMGNLLYTIAVILIIIWAVGFLGFHAGSIIHALLVIGIILFVVQLLTGRKA
ncbi:MAG: lmo0937 family membrane protein [Bacteroidota bacterium]